MNARIEQLIQNNLDALKALHKKIVNYSSGDITLKKLLYFLLQFQTFERIEVVMKLMLHIDLMDSGRITALVKKAMSNIDPTLQKKAIYITLGGIQDSSAMVAYPLIKEIFQDESSAAKYIGDIRALGTLLQKEGIEAVIFFDDNITTGTQLEDLFKELIEGKVDPEIVDEPLTPSQLAIFKTLPIRICYAVQLSQTASQRVKEFSEHYQLDLQVYAGQHDYDNKLEYGFGIITSEHEEAFAKQFLGEIARQLLVDKGWEEEKVEQRLLGFGNLSKLTAFYYNIPKALITPFWKAGFMDGKAWFPLLPEIQEQKKIHDRGILPDEDIMWDVDQVLKNAPANREPEITIGFQLDQETLQTITITVPSDEWLKTKIFNTHPLIVVLYEPQDPKEVFQYSLESIFPAEQPLKGQTKYERYKAAVDNYNTQNEAYYEQVQRYIRYYASRSIVPFAVHNGGQATATELKVQMTVNSSHILIERFSELKKPTFDLTKPKLSEFSAGGQVIVRSTPSMMSFFDAAPKQPFQIGPEYRQVVFRRDKLVHQNVGIDQIEIVRIDGSLPELTIPCTINYEQLPHLLDDNVIIRYEESDNVSKEQTKDILDEFKSFFSSPSFIPLPIRRLD